MLILEIERLNQILLLKQEETNKINKYVLEIEDKLENLKRENRNYQL